MNPKVITGARIVLGLMLVVFGLNKFLQFMPTPPMTDEAGPFMGALVGTGYMMPIVAVVEIAVGALLLFNRYVALALLLLAPISVNIVAFHLFLDIGGIGGAAFVFILNVFLLFAYRNRYQPLLTNH